MIYDVSAYDIVHRQSIQALASSWFFQIKTNKKCDLPDPNLPDLPSENSAKMLSVRAQVGFDHHGAFAVQPFPEGNGIDPKTAATGAEQSNLWMGVQNTWASVSAATGTYSGNKRRKKFWWPKLIRTPASALKDQMARGWISGPSKTCSRWNGAW